MNKIFYWIPIIGIALPSCTMDKFKNPKAFGFYRMIFCLIALALLMGSCVSEEQQRQLERERAEQEAKRQKPVVGYSETPRGISVQVVDGCQYVYAETRNGVAICHKANCNNPQHSN
jgi:hypothetical protein